MDIYLLKSCFNVGRKSANFELSVKCRYLQYNKKAPKLVSLDASGRGDRDRTCNRRFWRPLLYQLRYSPVYAFLTSIKGTFIFYIMPQGNVNGIY